MLMVQRRKYRGLAVVYATIGMTALCMFVSLAVDLGRVQLVKTELRQAADAAARAAAQNLSTSNAAAQSAGVATAAVNTADGSSVVITTSDVECGSWNSSTQVFTAGGSSPNAIRVTARRRAADGNAVPLMFAKVLGRNSCDVSAQSIALVSSTSTSYSFVGLNAINVSGNGGQLDVWAYDSTDSSYTGKALLASNGNINLSGTIYGQADLRYGPGMAANVSSPVNISGTRTALSSTMSFADPVANGADTTNNNSGIPSSISTGGAKPTINKSSTGTSSFAGGVYWLDTINMSAGTIKFTGAATLYINGGVNISNSKIVTYNNKPSNLVIYMMGTTGFNMSWPTADLYADIYGPKADLNYSSYWDIYGRVIMKGINGNGCGCLLYDRSLTGSSGAGTIALVR